MLRLRLSRATHTPIWHLAALARVLANASRLLPAPRELIDFERVNRQCGQQPLQPELSGLQLKTPDVLRQQVITSPLPPYRYRPSPRHQEVEAGLEDANRTVGEMRGPESTPPILLFDETTDVAPRRYQPLLTEPLTRELIGLEDLRRLERSFWSRSARIIGPVYSALPEETLTERWHLLPARQRKYLREAPLPKVLAAVAGMLIFAVAGGWFVQAQNAEANATAISQSAERQYREMLRDARSFGIPAFKLAAVRATAKTMDEKVSGPGFLPSPSQAAQLKWEANTYLGLARELQQLLRAGRNYWSWRAGQVYARLVEKVLAARDIGIDAPLPGLIACDRKSCFQSSMARDDWQIARWNQELAGIEAYQQQVLSSGSQQLVAAGQTQEVANLLAIRKAHPPVPLGELRPQANLSADHLARIAALAHFDAVWLQSQLVHTSHGPLIAMSTEEQMLSCYANGILVYQSPVVAIVPPLGRYNVTSKETDVPAHLWHMTAHGYRWVFGSIPYRVDFAGGEALQAAPWRTFFGPIGLVNTPYYAPKTTGSVDLPVLAAQFVYHWAPIGTPVFTY